MVQVSNLGYRPPVGLEHLQRASQAEQPLAPDQYSRRIFVQDTENGVEEELLYRDSCLVWTQGCRVKRIFTFPQEEEQVDHATLTWFRATDQPPGPSQDNVVDRKEHEDSQKNHDSLSASRERALVVLLGRRAHIYFSHGASYTTSVPFDVGSILPTPKGIVIQRKLAVPIAGPPTPALPQAPPNSFWSSQLHQSSPNASYRERARPRISAPPHRAPFTRLEDFVIERRAPQAADEMPRLFTLTDPLADIGLVGLSHAADQADLRASQNTMPDDSGNLFEHEEMLYFSSHNELPDESRRYDETLLIALTVNRIKRLYTIWQARFPEAKPKTAARRSHKTTLSPSARSRRRSSFAPHLSTGTATPVPKPRLKRESGVNKQAATNSNEENFAQALEALDGTEDDGGLHPVEQPFEGPRQKMKTDRRTSSMMARAELSSQDQNAFTELVRNPSGTHGSFRGNPKIGQTSFAAPERTSFGRSRLSGRASFAGDNTGLTDVDEMTTIADSIGDDIDSLDLEESESHHPAFDGLVKDISLSRIASIPFSDAYKSGTSALPPPTDQIKVFMASDLVPSTSQSSKEQGFAINLFFSDSNVLAEIDQKLQRHPAPRHVSGRKAVFTAAAKVKPQIRIYQHVVDTLSLHDGPITRTMCLVQPSQDSERSMLVLDTLNRFSKDGSSRFLPLENDAILTLFAGDFLNGRFEIASASQNARTILSVRVKPRDDQVFRNINAIQRVFSMYGLNFSFHSLWLICRGELTKQQDQQLNGEWQAFSVALCLVILLVVGIKDSTKSLKSSLTGNNLLENCCQYAFNLADGHIARNWLKQSLSSPTIQRPEPSSFLVSLIGALHILDEEAGLDILSESAGIGDVNLTNIIRRLCQWFHWDVWMQRSPVGREMSTHYQPCFKRRGILQWIGSDFQKRKRSHLPLFEEPTDSNDQTAFKEKQIYLGITDAIGSFTPRLIAITGCYSRLDENLAPNQSVEIMSSCGITTPMLETLPEAVASMLRSRIRQAQSAPNWNWPLKTLEFVGRQDLAVMLDKRPALMAWHDFDADKTVPDVEGICQNILKYSEGVTRPANIRKTVHSDMRQTMNLIYRSDRRWLEVAKILNPLRVAVAAIQPKPGSSETEFLEQQKAMAQLVYKRTMAIPSGSAILNFNSYQPLLTEKIEIYPFNTTCNMQPSNNTVNADKSNFTEEKVSWAFFHAGVHAGLRIRPDAPHIDTSWLVLNRPTELGNRHAGLLFALGLNGHLKAMAKWLAFKYLTPKHNMTSIGLLLGLAASHMGTMDSLVTRLLSVHITRLLPPGAAELNLSPLTQTAGVLGVGLLYHNSQHRRMSEIMLSELENIEDDMSPDAPGALRDEGYRLAAGISLGFINLGKGRDARILRDMRLVERLLAVAKGSRSIELIHVLDQATAGATVAMALIYMKSHNKRLAEEIGVPMNVQQFDYIRPDILLLRAVASNLIMWDDIAPRLDWINSRVPVEYRGDDAKETLLRLLESKPLDSSKLPIYNILAGLCWSIALKHSGLVPGSHEALEILVSYFDMITKVLDQVQPGALTYDELVTRDAVLRFQHLLALSMATVVAGSGDLGVLRRLRYLHGTIQVDQTFGLHQAAHMAIGILFMGQGRYTFGTSDLAIASLICAFYPLFPKDVLDNRAHLQALRHFWIFAAEARCLMLTDMDVRQPVTAPIVVQLKDGAERRMEAPCLIPPLDVIKAVHIQSPEHWPVTLDFDQNPAHLEAFRRQQTVALRRKDELAKQPDAFGAHMWLLKHAAEQRQLWRSSSGSKRLLGDNAFDWIFGARGLVLAGVNRAHARLGLLGSRRGDAQDVRTADRESLIRTLGDTATAELDDALVLGADAATGRDPRRLAGLRLVLDQEEAAGSSSSSWLRAEWLEALRRVVAERVARELQARDGLGGARQSGGMVLEEGEGSMDTSA